MAAAAVSGVSLCRSLIVPTCQRGPSSQKAPAASCSHVSALSTGSSTLKLSQERRVLISSFWGRTAEARFQKVCSNGAGKKRSCTGGALQTLAVSQETASIWTAVYGVLLLGGGTSAYLKSGSKQSVISGAVGAALSAFAYYLQSQESTHQTGFAVSFGYSLLFASVFGIRLFATKKPFPAAPLLALSLASAFVFASAYNI